MEEYVKPEVEIILFDTADVIATSPTQEGGVYEESEWLDD